MNGVSKAPTLIAMRPWLVWLAFSPVPLSAQTVFFHFTDSSVQSFALEDVRKVTFVNDEQVLWLADGTQYYWNVGTIEKFEFTEAVGVQRLTWGIEAVPVELYPNPSNGQVTIEISLVRTTRVTVDLIDMQGRWVKTLFMGERSAGRHRLQLSATDIHSGHGLSSYVLRVSTPEYSTSTTLMVE